MREALFILIVVFGLFALTAFRYRKQIAGMIGFARMLKETKDSITQISRPVASQATQNIPLVNCSQCGVWVPQNKARKVGDLFFCSDKCVSCR
ncbi:MAG: hypothetical protein ABIV48_00715 [Pyrinomonadaceae bacterium]